MWEAIKDAIFWVIEAFANIVGDWGMAIIIITLIFRALITPLMYKQSKSSYQMQKIQPLMNAVREKFANDPVRQNEEMQKLYAETKFNPLAGCIPMLIQMPIFIALFQVLNERLAQMTTAPSFYGIVPNLVLSPSKAFAEGFGTAIPYIVLLLIFAFATFVPMLLTQNQQSGSQRTQMLVMSGVMSVFMLFIGWGSPAGVLLFWGASSLLAILQQQLSLRHIKKVDAQHEEEVEVKPIEVNVTRKVKKKRPTKKR